MSGYIAHTHILPVVGTYVGFKEGLCVGGAPVFCFKSNKPKSCCMSNTRNCTKKPKNQKTKKTKKGQTKLGAFVGENIGALVGYVMGYNVVIQRTLKITKYA